MSETTPGTDRVELTKDEKRALNIPLVDTHSTNLYAAVESIVAARVQALTAERDELRANWAHDVSTLESLIVQDEAGFRRLRKAYEDLVDTSATQRLAAVRVELDGAYDLLREAAAQVETAEVERDAARAELAAANTRCAELEADKQRWINDLFDFDELTTERDALQATLDRVVALADEWDRTQIIGNNTYADELRAALTPEGKP